MKAENAEHKNERKMKMKRNFGFNKKFAAGAAALTMLVSGAAYAQGGAAIIADGAKVDGAQTYEIGETTYIPVRKLCEQLGMTVEWDAENEIVTLVNLPVYIRFSPYKDGYTFAKTAPMKLGVDPICEDGTTYVPINFIDEILQAEYTVEENGDINVKYATDNMADVKVISKQTENGVKSLKVYDAVRGEVIVNFTDETEAVDENGKKITFEDIAEDAHLLVEYSEAMTLSLPPIANAVKVEVVKDENNMADVKVLSKQTENGVKSLKVYDAVRGEVIVNFTDETEAVDENGNKITFEDIAEDAHLLIEYSDAMTFSLPPITNAVKIKVDGGAAPITPIAPVINPVTD